VQPAFVQAAKVDMIWFWSRDTQTVRLETRYDNDTSEFVMVIEHPDGRQDHERFVDIDAFRERLVELERHLESEHWTPSGTPQFVPEGFPNQRLGSRSTDDKSKNRDGATANRTYTTGKWVFELALSMTVLKGQSLWTVERVVETRWLGVALAVPGMDTVVSSTADAAFARACDRIDKWLLSRL
jgi:hypothetical protein